MELYDMDGQPMSFGDWQKWPMKDKIVDTTTMVMDGEPLTIVTAWAGFDVSQGKAQEPLIFETFSFHGDHGQCGPRAAYPDKLSAKTGHAMMVAMAKTHGGRTGVRALPYFFKRGIMNMGVKGAWALVAVWASLLAFQLSSMTLALFTANVGWSTWINGAVTAFDAWMVWMWTSALKRARAKRAEERRTAEDNAKFDEIVHTLR